MVYRLFFQTKYSVFSERDGEAKRGGGEKAPPPPLSLYILLKPGGPGLKRISPWHPLAGRRRRLNWAAGLPWVATENFGCSV